MAAVFCCEAGKSCKSLFFHIKLYIAVVFSFVIVKKLLSRCLADLILHEKERSIIKKDARPFYRED